jgi:peptidoglycan/LPS O-acetylase OafA/YrhL
MTVVETLPRPNVTTLEHVRVASDGNFPGFLFLRHFLAIVILAHHSRVLLRGIRVGYEAETAGHYPSQGQALGSFLMSAEAFRPLLYALVGAFFALSGFLVAGSALRTKSVRTFLAFRGLRIFPALLSEITLSALVLGTFVTVVPLSNYFTSPELYAYFLNILGFVHYTLPGVFESNPIPQMVNANLWTLGPEFYCYLLMAIFMASGLFYRRRALLVGVAAATLILLVLDATHLVDLATRQDSTRFARWLIVYMFFLGVILAVYADAVPRSPVLFGLAAVGYVVSMWTSASDILACVFLAYCTIYVGTLDLRWFDRLLNSDYSYGLYLYGYPITQTIVFFALPAGILKHDAMSTVVLFFATLTLTIIFSAISWRYVERPALKLRKLFMGQR